ncbi:MAG TPA: YjbH domain-containing protein [Thermohalobaculum sp.]|nr:YjbH domain-containing protein [Thermohalobaculum sp.]
MAVALALSAMPPCAIAEEPVVPERPTQNLFGMTGLIDMPTAEMQPDGQVSFTASYFDGFLRNTATAQFLPGIEAAFRYSVLEGLEGPGGETLYDRSFDVKVRLVQEGPAWPGVAVGLQDFLGTGVFSGEYVVATKRLFDGDLKVTGGVGWGRLAGANPIKNPFCTYVDRLCARGGEFTQGGTVDFGSFFSGRDMGLFGGVEWRTPIDGLTLKAEYSDDDYDREIANGVFKPDLPLNFGAEYRLTQGIEIGAYYMYGSAVGLRLSLSGNPFRPLAATDTEPPARPFMPRPEPDPAAAERQFGEMRTSIGSQPPAVAFGEAGISRVEITVGAEGVRWASAELPPSADYVCPENAARAIDAEYGVIDAVRFHHADGTPVCTVALRPAGQRAVRQALRGATDYPTDWYADPVRRQAVIDALAAALDPIRIGLFGVELEPERVTVYIENRRYRAMPRAIGRTARALAAVMPPSVALFEIVPVEGSLPTASVMLERAALEDQVGRPDAAWQSWVSARVGDAAPPDWSEVEGTLDQFPRFSWRVGPIIPLHLFDPDQPVRADLSVDVGGRVEFLPGLSINAAMRKRIIGDLDEIERESDSVLPRVRSDIAKYLREGDPALARLTADYVRKLHQDGLYGRLSAGLLEPMFGGVSAELLWKPADQNWGIGGEINWVKQRDFDQRFDFRRYEVVTGHASVYWDTGFYGMAVQVDGGRYLAGDWGGTFALKRRFANGWEIGGFLTLTDVPFEEFGEGSFDKGIFLTIPLSWAGPIETRGRYSTSIRPLTRDGGQRLGIANPLYPLVADMDRGGLGTGWGSFWE